MLDNSDDYKKTYDLEGGEEGDPTAEYNAMESETPAAPEDDEFKKA
jgi:hypothetical protein